MKIQKWIAGIALYLACASFAYSQKNDTIYLVNGDHITGEIKNFDKGLLLLSTDAMKKVNIEYEDINTIYSKKNYEFRTKSGYRYYGYMLQSKSIGTIELVTSEDTIPKPLWDIVHIFPINKRFWQRIDGSVDLGVNYTKSIDVFQYSLNGYVSYRSSNVSTRLDYTSIFSDSGSEGIAKNNNVGLNVTRYLPNKWFARFQVDYQQNTELNLDHRIQSGPAGGYDLIRTTPMRLYVMAGVLVNREKLIDATETTENVEALLSLQYYWYQYRHPKVDFTTGLNVYPSFTNAGRVRLEFNINAKYEIVTDVFLSLTYYNNYDNEPGEGNSSQNDSNFIASLGYTF